MRPDAPILHDECHRYQLSGQEAVRHLLTVACGLDSAIPGDSQILGQVKTAMNIAVHNGTIGGTLHRALTLAVRAGKRARTEIRFGWGSASLGSAIADLLAERDADQDAANRLPKVSIIGAGDMARDIGQHLAKRGGRQITFLNRTNSKAAQLAELCGGNSLGWHSLESSLQGADVVIAATACISPILSRGCVWRRGARWSETSGRTCERTRRLTVRPGLDSRPKCSGWLGYSVLPHRRSSRNPQDFEGLLGELAPPSGISGIQLPHASKRTLSRRPG
jgi:hypothetical protein